MIRIDMEQVKQSRMVAAIDEFEQYMERWVKAWFAGQAPHVVFIGFLQVMHNGVTESTPVTAGCPPVSKRKHYDYAEQETKK